VPERLKQLFKNWYPGAIVEVTPLTNGRVSAVLTSAAFDGQDYALRQREVWSRLRKELREESTQVSTVFIVTPEEAEAMSPSAG
jgi:acid stress-induced BolA-like protein IbaG/YrbA